MSQDNEGRTLGDLQTVEGRVRVKVEDTIYINMYRNKQVEKPCVKITAER